ncbi:hypothetical protein [Dictyobacter arantiisoli]|uniref:Uncharacterized protein n=1 Tax=Dictyobacter arantiisoli TaxID=2014874 RepID=A0A5A5TFD5_9CHLR|nr:hypothetical protein [Dictyobacter arantiisoli]GCF10057.1 hypothetical protein KDI_36210 [Dictyobacter arantiisoli]
MAMGLNFLGRGNKRKAVIAGVCHVFGAIIGGSMLGGGLGWLGALLLLPTWRIEVLCIIGIFAIWHSFYGSSMKLGRPCQVNRRWKNNNISAAWAYFLWGIQLGCGLVTFIPYSCFAILMGAQATSGPWNGLISGAIYGGTRELVTLLALFHKNKDGNNLLSISSYFPLLEPLARYSNICWIIIGVPLLIIFGFLK